MKSMLIITMATMFSFVAYAQPKQVSQAIISTTTNVIAPEEDESPAFQPEGGGGRGGFNFRNFGDGETKSTTYLKNDLVKTVLKSEMGRSIIIRNNETKITTTLLEIMGNKTGFYISDDEQKEMMKQMDSMRQARRKNDSSQAQAASIMPSSENPVELMNSIETKKIAGYLCTKAWIVTTRLLGLKDSVMIWYSPEIKLNNLQSTGGLSGFGNMINSNARGFDLVDGFVMGYEMKMPRNRRMEVYVTKLELQKDVADKEFDIPKDYEVKPMKEMQTMFGGGQGGFQMRRQMQ